MSVAQFSQLGDICIINNDPWVYRGERGIAMMQIPNHSYQTFVKAMAEIRQDFNISSWEQEKEAAELLISAMDDIAEIDSKIEPLSYARKARIEQLRDEVGEAFGVSYF